MSWTSCTFPEALALLRVSQVYLCGFNSAMTMRLQDIGLHFFLLSTCLLFLNPPPKHRCTFIFQD